MKSTDEMLVIFIKTLSFLEIFFQFFSLKEKNSVEIGTLNPKKAEINLKDYLINTFIEK